MIDYYSTSNGESQKKSIMNERQRKTNAGQKNAFVFLLRYNIQLLSQFKRELKLLTKLISTTYVFDLYMIFGRLAAATD